MSDSSRSDGLGAKQRANEQERLVGIKRWVEYIRENPPDVWGEEQNRLVNSQLESARETETSPEHKRRVEAFGEAMTSDDAETMSDE